MRTVDNIFKLKLTTLSPIHIGCQDTLSPYMDFIYEDRKVYLIDERKLMRFFKEQEDLDTILDQYLEIIGQQAGSNISGKSNLRDFFGRYGLNIEDFASTKLQANGSIAQVIQKTIHTSGRPYIPGSTLKGAIRTCLLYYHNKKNSISEREIFGCFGEDVLKNLSISDTNPIGKEDLVVLRAARYNLAKNSEDVPVVYESIQKNVEFTFSLKTQPTADNRFNYLNINNPKHIFKIINEFYKDSIYRELEVLERNSCPMISEIVSFYHELKKRIDTVSSDNRAAIIRLGGGKTFFDNTISYRLPREDLKKIILDLSRGKIKTDANFFPKTRTFVGYGGVFDQVLGWAIIEPNNLER